MLMWEELCCYRYKNNWCKHSAWGSNRSQQVGGKQQMNWVRTLRMVGSVDGSVSGTESSLGWQHVKTSSWDVYTPWEMLISPSVSFLPSLLLGWINPIQINTFSIVIPSVRSWSSHKLLIESSRRLGSTWRSAYTSTDMWSTEWLQESRK